MLAPPVATGIAIARAPGDSTELQKVAIAGLDDAAAPDRLAGGDRVAADRVAGCYSAAERCAIDFGSHLFVKLRLGLPDRI